MSHGQAVLQESHIGYLYCMKLNGANDMGQWKKMRQASSTVSCH